MNTVKNTLSEQLLDAAASDALGANTPAESAAYQQELAGSGDEDARRMDVALRETVARLSAASPHMAPPPDLRGKILQATAPVTFKMEDYRKATQEPSRFYKWGFYAAMLFLMAGAYFNMQANQRVKAYAQLTNLQGKALAAFVNPKSQQINLRDADKKLNGVALADPETKTAVMLLPKGTIPAGRTVQEMTITENGKEVKYQTLLVEGPDDFLTAPKGKAIDTVMKINKTEPDLLQPPRMAGQR